MDICLITNNHPCLKLSLFIIQCAKYKYMRTTINTCNVPNILLCVIQRHILTLHQFIYYQSKSNLY